MKYMLFYFFARRRRHTRFDCDWSSDVCSSDLVWRSLRAEPFMTSLSDDDVWDLVAFAWESNTSPEAIGEGGKSYAANCAACHGEQGGGDGVMAEALVKQLSTGMGHEAQAPASFIDAASMLGASPALLQGKI